MKTLVVVLCQTRAHELTFSRFKKNVVDVLDADVCVCIGVTKDYDYTNPFYQLAKYHFIYDEENDPTFQTSAEYSYQYEKMCSQAFANDRHYTEFFNLIDRMNNQRYNFIISTYIHIFFLWFFQKNMKEHGLLWLYDRFIIVRSDAAYDIPFPSMELLDPSFIWIPNGEDYGGICDRSVVLSKATIEPYLNILQNFYLRSNEFYLKISKKNNLNMEKILLFNLEQNGILDYVQRFPYIMYHVAAKDGVSRWAMGNYHSDLDCFVKYEEEYVMAMHYKSILMNYSTIDEFYKEEITNCNRI